MRVTFIGAGAMGGLFGSLLTEAGLNVQLIDIWEKHVAMIRTKGLRIDCDGQVRHVKLDIHTDYASLDEAQRMQLLGQLIASPPAIDNSSSVARSTALP